MWYNRNMKRGEKKMNEEIKIVVGKAKQESTDLGALFTFWLKIASGQCLTRKDIHEYLDRELDKANLYMD